MNTKHRKPTAYSPDGFYKSSDSNHNSGAIAEIILSTIIIVAALAFILLLMFIFSN